VKAVRTRAGVVVALVAAIVAYGVAASKLAPPFGDARPLVDAPDECAPAPKPPGPGTLRARLGAYYFGGWSGPTTSRHFAGLEMFKARQPVSGWRDADTNSMKQQLQWARAYGLSFFAFDWYHDAERSSDPFLNAGLQNYVRVPHVDRAGVKFAVVYVNTNDGDNFVVPPAAWGRVARFWATLFADPDYVRVGGKPLFIVLDALRMEGQFGSRDGVNRALGALRGAARERRLPGVFVVGGVNVGPGFDWHGFRQRIAGEDWDAVTQYAYPAVAGIAAGPREFDEIVRAERRTWAKLAASATETYIPDVMVGWDPRPWNETVGGRLFWVRRNPSAVAAFVDSAIDWAHRHRRPLDGEPPIVMLEAWNELGEGSYIVPTIGDCHEYGATVARVASTPRRGAGRYGATPARSRKSASTTSESNSSSARSRAARAWRS
jgi:Glycosyltransferase WbsX